LDSEFGEYLPPALFSSQNTYRRIASRSLVRMRPL